MVIKRKILIVDDDRLICWSLRETLSHEGYEVLTVETGEDAVKEAEKFSFDLLITDLKLPGMDGWGVVSRVKEMNPEIKVVVISAFGNDDAPQKAKSFGASHFFNKPFEMTRIKETVNTILSGEFRN